MPENESRNDAADANNDNRHLCQELPKSEDNHVSHIASRVSSLTSCVRRCEKMVYGNEVLHKTLSGALGASRLKLWAGLGEDIPGI
jgi:hypothetical protein